MSRKIIALVLALGLVLALTASAAASSTVVPGQQNRNDADNNGYPDVGVVVTGKYVSVYSYDASGSYYWDLGDGRIQSSSGVTSPADLDQTTLTVCTYQVQYRGMFNNDPFLDSGWIKNEINCQGVDQGTFNSTIVSQDDPRYTGDPAQAIWGTWEYHVNTQSGIGNLVEHSTNPSHN